MALCIVRKLDGWTGSVAWAGFSFSLVSHLGNLITSISSIPCIV